MIRPLIFGCLLLFLVAHARPNNEKRADNNGSEILAKKTPNEQPETSKKHAAGREIIQLAKSHSRFDGEDWRAPYVTTTLKIGTPAVTFVLQMDQYFEDALLVGPDCKSTACIGINKNRTIYDPSKSSTSKDQGDPAKLHYGSSITGEYYTDTVQVDGITDTDVAFAVLKTANSQFYRVNYDGVFGLSFLSKPRGKKNFNSPVDSILKGADKKLVNLWFNQATSNDDRYGLLTFGKVNTDKCSDNVQYSLVSDDDFTFRVQKLRFGKFVAHRELNAVINPQSPNIGLPTTLYKDLLRVATGSTSSDYTDCDNIKGMTLDVKIGGVFYSLKVEDFTWKEKTSWNTYNCHFLIEDLGDEFDSAYSLGEPFFRRFCTTYDVANEQIGFSAAK